MDLILERKSVEDLNSSIKGASNRYDRQKVGRCLLLLPAATAAMAGLSGLGAGAGRRGSRLSVLGL